MLEDPERYPREDESDPKGVGMGEDSPQGGGKGGIGGQGGEGTGAQAASSPIGEEGEPGRTQHPAPDDDVGVPEDAERAKDG